MEQNNDMTYVQARPGPVIGWHGVGNEQDASFANPGKILVELNRGLCYTLERSIFLCRQNIHSIVTT